MTDVTETAKPKPLWWRVGKGKWHRDTLKDGYDGFLSEEEVQGVIAGGKDCLWSWCWFDLEVTGECQFRRSAPPVAQQCAKCRAAKAKARKEKARA